jgi:uncharacterized protein
LTEYLTGRRALVRPKDKDSVTVTPVPEYGFPGLQPGDRWCVVAQRWFQAYAAGVAPPVVLAATSVRALDVIELAVLQRHAVDVPEDISSLE